MASPMGPEFAVYTLTHVVTGQLFYSTFATEDEIHNANFHLKAAGQALRYYAKGHYSQPSLHSEGS